MKWRLAWGFLCLVVGILYIHAAKLGAPQCYFYIGIANCLVGAFLVAGELGAAR